MATSTAPRACRPAKVAPRGHRLGIPIDLRPTPASPIELMGYVDRFAHTAGGISRSGLGRRLNPVNKFTAFQTRWRQLEFVRSCYCWWVMQEENPGSKQRENL